MKRRETALLLLFCFLSCRLGKEPSRQYLLKLELSDSITRHDSVSIELLAWESDSVLSSIWQGKIDDPQGIPEIELQENIREEFQVEVQGWSADGELEFRTRYRYRNGRRERLDFPTSKQVQPRYWDPMDSNQTDSLPTVPTPPNILNPFPPYDTLVPFDSVLLDSIPLSPGMLPETLLIGGETLFFDSLFQPIDSILPSDSTSILIPRDSLHFVDSSSLPDTMPETLPDLTPPKIYLRPNWDTLAVTTDSQVIISGVAEDDGLTHVSVDSVEASIRKAPIPGLFFWQVVVPLVEGMNFLTVEVFDSSGNQASRSLRVLRSVPYVDTIPPKIVVEFPAAQSVHSKPRVCLKGLVSDAGGVNQVTLQGSPVSLKQNSWHGCLDLTATSPESNEIVIEATDVAGNQSTSRLRLFYNPPDPPFEILVSAPRHDTLILHRAGYVLVMGKIRSPNRKLSTFAVNEKTYSFVGESPFRRQDGIAFHDTHQNGEIDFNARLYIRQPGNHPIRLVAVNENGDTTDQTIHVFYGPPDKIRPKLQVLSPSPDSLLGASFQVEVEATDNVGVRWVRINGRMAQQVELQGNRWRITLSHLSLKTSFLSILAADSAGNQEMISYPVQLKPAIGELKIRWAQFFYANHTNQWRDHCTPRFHLDSTQYRCGIPPHVKDINFDITIRDENDIVTVDGNRLTKEYGYHYRFHADRLAEGPDSVAIRVRKPSHSNLGEYKEYRITMQLLQLRQVKVSGYKLKPAFDPKIYHYTIVSQTTPTSLELRVDTQVDSVLINNAPIPIGRAITVPLKDSVFVLKASNDGQQGTSYTFRFQRDGVQAKVISSQIGSQSKTSESEE